MSVQLVIGWIFLAVIGIGLPLWFVLSLIAYKKDKKDTSKPNSTGLFVNFILSVVGLIAWSLIILATIAFVVLGAIFMASM